MSYKIIEIEGIGEVYEAKLATVDITTTEQLLETGRTPKGRHELADKSGISYKLILKWVNHADLMRIKGVGGQFAELLEAAGVDTVKEFRHRVPATLHKKLQEVNEERHISGRVPSLSELTNMIAQAKELPPVVEY